MPIIRRNNCVFATLGTWYSVWITVWYALWNETAFSPDDGHIVAQNMYRLINILRIKLCTKLALFTRLYGDVWSTKRNNSALNNCCYN